MEMVDWIYNVAIVLHLAEHINTRVNTKTNQQENLSHV